MKIRFFIPLIFLFSCFVSCKSEVSLKIKNNNNLQIAFSGSVGKGIEKFLNSAGADVGMLNPDELKQSFEYNGFEDVLVLKDEKNQFFARMLLSEKNSDILGKSLIEFGNKKVKITLTPQSFKEFYDLADENLAAFLDLFMAPVFNDDELSESEYIELLASVYGNDFAQEIKDGSLKIVLLNEDGKNVSKLIPYTKLFTLKEEMVLQL